MSKEEYSQEDEATTIARYKKLDILELNEEQFVEWAEALPLRKEGGYLATVAELLKQYHAPIEPNILQEVKGKDARMIFYMVSTDGGFTMKSQAILKK